MAGAFVGWNIVVQLTFIQDLHPPLQLAHRLPRPTLHLYLIGAAIATFFGGKLINIIANRITHRNYGHREPEYRLLAIVIPAFIGLMCVLIFGLTVAYKSSLDRLRVRVRHARFGLTAMSNMAVTYAVDSYLPVSSPMYHSSYPIPRAQHGTTQLVGEVLVIVSVVRGIIGCMLALFAFN